MLTVRMILMVTRCSLKMLKFTKCSTDATREIRGAVREVEQKDPVKFYLV